MNSRYKLHLMGHQVNPFLFISKRQPHSILRAPATMRRQPNSDECPCAAALVVHIERAKHGAAHVPSKSGVQIPLGRDFLVEVSLAAGEETVNEAAKQQPQVQIKADEKEFSPVQNLVISTTTPRSSPCTLSTLPQRPPGKAGFEQHFESGPRKRLWRALGENINRYEAQFAPSVRALKPPLSLSSASYNRPQGPQRRHPRQLYRPPAPNLITRGGLCADHFTKWFALVCHWYWFGARVEHLPVAAQQGTINPRIPPPPPT